MLETTENSLSKCVLKLTNLYKEHKDDEDLKDKIEYYICNLLPIYIKNQQTVKITKEKRIVELNETMDEFIQKFVSINNFYYCSNTEIYFYYDGLHFNTYKEDTIIYDISKQINNNLILKTKKNKIKNLIIKEIKDKNIFDAIPESDTIQSVISFLFPLFLNRYNVKYFLTIIGDNILKKRSNSIFLTNNNCKELIKMISDLSYQYFNSITIKNFKYKYHEIHTNCRIVQSNKNTKFDIDKSILLDLFVVALHYSNKYKNSETYLQNNMSKDTTKIIKITENQDIFVDFFISSMLEKTTDNFYISSKILRYIWKLFLIQNNLPVITFLNNFKKIIKDKLIYNEEKDAYYGVTCKYLTYITSFFKFWNKNIYHHANDANDENADIEYFEISEIITMFKYWFIKNYKDNTKDNTKDNIIIDNLEEENIIELIKDFYEKIEIENNKYILNISCKLWSKNNDLKKYFSYLNKNYNKSYISIDILYYNYCTYVKDKSLNFIMDKQYFTKYCYDNFSQYIDQNNIMNLKKYALELI